MPKVSVIIPVYGAERYIERCARSLFEQTLDDMEYIFVDDCTPDRSMEVLKTVLSEYPYRAAQVRVITMAKNGKQAAAREAGMRAATGEYLIQCDPDDWVDAGMYEGMYACARERGADIVRGAFVTHDGAAMTTHGAGDFCGTGKDALIRHDYSWRLYTLLISNKLISNNEIYPYPGINCGEDVNVAMRAYYYAEKVCAYGGCQVYHYDLGNPDSITKTPFRQVLDRYLRPNVDLLDRFFDVMGDDGRDIMCRYKLRVKAPLFYMKETRDVDLWYELWPEVTEYYRKNIKEFGLHGLMMYIGGKCRLLAKLYGRYMDLKH